MLAAFLIGLVGSLHCIGMCGPLALALPGKNRKGGQFVLGRVLYNSGRVLSYAGLGMLVATLGVAAAMFELQRYFSLILGALLLFWALREWGLLGKRKPNRNAVIGWLMRRTSGWMQRGDTGSLFMIGLFNGLLPCGFVYAGLFHAALSDSVLEGGMKMVLFGMGTWPVMLAVSLSGKWITPFLRRVSVRGLPVLMLVMGSLLMLRGMALGIPYVSPAMESSVAGTHISCHDQVGKIPLCEVPALNNPPTPYRPYNAPQTRPEEKP